MVPSDVLVIVANVCDYNVQIPASRERASLGLSTLAFYISNVQTITNKYLEMYLYGIVFDTLRINTVSDSITLRDGALTFTKHCRLLAHGTIAPGIYLIGHKLPYNQNPSVPADTHLYSYTRTYNTVPSRCSSSPAHALRSDSVSPCPRGLFLGPVPCDRPVPASHSEKNDKVETRSAAQHVSWLGSKLWIGGQR